jgi:hypothetical protein
MDRDKLRISTIGPASFRFGTESLPQGNHDAPIAADVEMWRKRLSNATLLINEGVIIEGYTSGLAGDAGSGSLWGADEAGRDALYSEIPSDPPIDILITAGRLLESWTVDKDALHFAGLSFECVLACT